jgi:hypothetical protein
MLFRILKLFGIDIPARNDKAADYGKSALVGTFAHLRSSAAGVANERIKALVRAVCQWPPQLFALAAGQCLWVGFWAPAQTSTL